MHLFVKFSLLISPFYLHIVHFPPFQSTDEFNKIKIKKLYLTLRIRNRQQYSFYAKNKVSRDKLYLPDDFFFYLPRTTLYRQASDKGAPSTFFTPLVWRGQI